MNLIEGYSERQFAQGFHNPFPESPRFKRGYAVTDENDSLQIV
jgi:hypothetical protein